MFSRNGCIAGQCCRISWDRLSLKERLEMVFILRCFSPLGEYCILVTFFQGFPVRGMAPEIELHLLRKTLFCSRSTRALKQKGQQFNMEKKVVSWNYLHKINAGFSQGLASIV